MTEHQTPASERPVEPASGKKSHLRLIGLFAILILVIGGMVYDRQYAEPAVKAANENLLTYVDEFNAKGIPPLQEDGGSRTTSPRGALLAPSDIQKHLGMSPLRTKVDGKNFYIIEVYSWWGWLPVNKRYITVVYHDDKDPRYYTHYVDSWPTADELPGQPRQRWEGRGGPNPPSKAGEEKDRGPAEGATSGKADATPTEKPAPRPAPAAGKTTPPGDAK